MSTPRRAASALAAMAIALAAASCCENVQCDVCDSGPFAIYVRDAGSSDPIEMATVTSNGEACQEGESGPGNYVCPGNVGTNQVVIAADGYAATTTTVDVFEDDGDGCCSCGPSGEDKFVTLQPA